MYTNTSLRDLVNRCVKLAHPSFLNPPGTKRGLGLSGVPKKSGLGESLGKASLANTSFGSSRLFPSHGGPPSREELAPHSSKAWPDEALERGLPRPFAKKNEKLGEGKVCKNVSGGTPPPTGRRARSGRDRQAGEGRREKTGINKKFM
jgi:hypothetical protein